MSILGLNGFLWAAGFACNCVLLSVLLLKRRVPSFPIFSVFVAFGLLRTAWLFKIRSDYGKPLYGHTYWGLTLVDATLQFALICEIAGKVFRPRGRWAIDVRGKLLLSLVGSVALAAFLAFLQKPVGHDVVYNLAIRIGVFSVVLNAALFAVMVMLSSDAGFNWRSHIASIATGMAVYCLIGLLIEIVSRFGEANLLRSLLDTLQTTRRWLYLACEVYWSYALWHPEPSPRRMSPRMEGQVAALEEAVIRRNGEWRKR